MAGRGPGLTKRVTLGEVYALADVAERQTLAQTPARAYSDLWPVFDVYIHNEMTFAACFDFLESNQVVARKQFKGVERAFYKRKNRSAQN